MVSVRASPSWQIEPTNSSPCSTSCARAGPPRGRRARPPGAGRQQGRRRAGEGVARSPVEGDLAPMFVFDAGYDPVKLQQGLEESKKSPWQILVRLRAGRSFYGDPSLSEPPANIGRSRRLGSKMKCSDPSTWPEPSAEHTCEDGGYGAVRVRAWADLHPKVASHEGPKEDARARRSSTRPSSRVPESSKTTRERVLRWT